MRFTNRNLVVHAIESVPPAGGSAPVAPQPEGKTPEETSKTYDDDKDHEGHGDDEDDPKARSLRAKCLQTGTSPLTRGKLGGAGSDVYEEPED